MQDSPTTATRDARPLRVLMVVDGYYPSTGGSEIQVKVLSRALIERGHDVSILAPRLEPGAAVHEVIDGIPVERIAYPRIRVLGALILMLRFGWCLLWRRRHYDAIHIHMVKNLATIAGLLRPLLRAVLVIKISGAWEFDGGVLDPTKRRGPVTRLRNYCIRGVDYVQCISRYTRERLRQAGYPERKLCMIPNAVQTERFRAPVAPRDAGSIPTAIFVGRIQPVKGLDVLLRAWKTVLAGRRAQLLIAGDGAMLAELKRIAVETGIAESVRFAGEVKNVPELLAQADVYVQPSYQEGLPNSVLEAMAVGLPIVATRISGNEDVVAVGVNGILVPSGDAESLAQALDAILADRERARELGRQSRRIIEDRFQMSAVIGQLVKAYRREF